MLSKTTGIQQTLKGWKSSDPDVLFLIDGEVGVEVDHLWGSIRRSGVSCDLHRTEDMRRYKGIKDRQELVSLEVMTSEVILGKPPVCVYGRNIIDLNGQCFLLVSLVIQSKGFWFLFSTMMLRVLPQIY